MLNSLSGKWFIFVSLVFQEFSLALSIGNSSSAFSFCLTFSAFVNLSLLLSGRLVLIWECPCTVCMCLIFLVGGLGLIWMQVMSFLLSLGYAGSYHLVGGGTEDRGVRVGAGCEAGLSLCSNGGGFWWSGLSWFCSVCFPLFQNWDSCPRRRGAEESGVCVGSCLRSAEDRSLSCVWCAAAFAGAQSCFLFSTQMQSWVWVSFLPQSQSVHPASVVPAPLWSHTTRLGGPHGLTACVEKWTIWSSPHEIARMLWMCCLIKCQQWLPPPTQVPHRDWHISVSTVRSSIWLWPPQIQCFTLMWSESEGSAEHLGSGWVHGEVVVDTWKASVCTSYE